MKLYLVYEAASIDPDNHLPACFKNIPRRLIATTDETKAIELLNEFRWVEEVDIPIDIRIPTAKVKSWFLKTTLIIRAFLLT